VSSIGATRLEVQPTTSGRVPGAIVGGSSSVAASNDSMS
jgi:hypothetical protein